jgi:hypothetical protein
MHIGASEVAHQPFFQLEGEVSLRVLGRLKIFELDQEVEIAVLGVNIVPGC